MFDSEHTLRHLPFFEEVVSNDEGLAAWNAGTAGLVTLRLVDQWLEDGPVTDDSWSLRSVRAAIDALHDGTPIKSLLARVVDALQEQKPDIHVVVTPLMAYGQALEYDAKFLLAADVYSSVLRHLHPTADSDAVIAANLRLGQCYRTLNMVDAAAAAYGDAGEVSVAVGDMVGTLRARIGEARVAVMRGNHPQADQILADTVQRAAGPALCDVRSRALHDRAGIALNRGDHELGVRLAYEAMHLSQTSSERDRILADIALAFMNLGVFSAARDAYLLLSVTAQEQYIRWSAQLNLMEMATDTGSEVLFEQYRRALESATLPPYLAGAYDVSVGRGLHRFGSTEQARVRLERARLFAQEHKLHLVYFKAEEILAELEKATPPVRTPSEVPLDLEEVASAIRGFRESAGIS